MSSIAGANVTSGFIDLAAYDAMETHLYGGDNSITYFLRETTRSSWFSKLPVQLSKQTGTANFGQEFSVVVARGGDYLMNVWLRVKVPALKNTKANSSIRWTDNFMHNLVQEVTISFNDLTAQTITSEFLDFWSTCNVPGGKSSGYANMIGYTHDLVGGTVQNATMPSKYLNLPIPFFFTRDTGLALPTAALPYNEIKIHFKLRDWKDLLISQSTNDNAISVPLTSDMENVTPALTEVSVMGTYAILTNEEREAMSLVSRDMIIEQCQMAPRIPIRPLENEMPHIDLRFSHPIKELFFAVKNVTHPNIHSNYTAASPIIASGTNKVTMPPKAQNPLSHVSLIYENTARLNNMGVDYFSYVDPYFFAPCIPKIDGVMAYCYTMNMGHVDPMGSTNFGRLSNITLSAKVTANSKTTSAASGNTDGHKVAQKFELVVIGVNHNVARISNGSFGFPIL
ncbi:Major capsid protein [Scale drop disease virus]|uniref:Major capsid protein n=5 Tax=Scale drop disease virus TaxID=1697349 RepID=A0A0K1L763_9VIRU|nr:ORF_060L [Scale drop disease virus]AKU37475.1 ORF_060L [Scale drop disease virus]AYM25702.1 MCP [Scale drop disease virus]AYM25703.1 MCP [Scale drop disease virus]AYM25704.1 MCP [Scale drop disease virus]QLI60730.1 Major capsid protein [Scale drop disease virus]